jgi:hypothetical protein
MKDSPQQALYRPLVDVVELKKRKDLDAAQWRQLALMFAEQQNQALKTLTRIFEDKQAIEESYLKDTALLIAVNEQALAALRFVLETMTDWEPKVRQKQAPHKSHERQRRFLEWFTSEKGAFQKRHPGRRATDEAVIVEWLESVDLYLGTARRSGRRASVKTMRNRLSDARQISRLQNPEKG